MHMCCLSCGSCECTCYDTDFEYLQEWALIMNASMQRRGLWVGYLAPAHHKDDLAQAWDCYLQIYCIWSKKDFAPNYCWNKPVPPLKNWEKEVRKLNSKLYKE